MKVVRPARIQAHRVYGGTEYGPRQLILVDAPDSRLMWIPGHSGYAGRMLGTVYSKSTLWLVRDDTSFSRRVVFKLAPSKRLTAELLHSSEVQAAVTAMWGAEVAKALEIDATLLLGPEYAEGGMKTA